MKKKNGMWKKKTRVKKVRKTSWICKYCGFEAKTEFQRGYHQAQHLDITYKVKSGQIKKEDLEDKLKEMILNEM